MKKILSLVLALAMLLSVSSAFATSTDAVGGMEANWWVDADVQKSAEFYEFFDRSYNVPEFMVEPVSITPQEFAEVIKKEPSTVKYSSNVK